MTKFTFTEVQWDAAKEEIRDVLLRKVKEKDIIFYSDLVAEVHTVKLRAKDPALDTLLDEISREEDAAGRGMLSVVVVRKPPQESLPGPGFFKLAKKLGRDTSDRNTCWAEELAKVYSRSEMKKRTRAEDVDELVTAQADADSAWEKPVKVKRSRAAVLTFDEEHIARLPITVDPETMSGAPVFRGTRVPVTALLDNLAAGLTLDEFLDNFPTVRREQAIQVLDFYKETLARLGRAA